MGTAGETPAVRTGWKPVPHPRGGFRVCFQFVHFPLAMKIIASPESARRFCRAAPRPLVLVPTMGALHAGHAALVRRARELASGSGTVAVSIFVNPAQFGPKEDFSRYPRPFAADAKLCRDNGVDLIFHPPAEKIYAPDFSTWVEEKKLSGVLCGASRPGHFRGVCTVVAKLFNILAPDIAVFGRKDYQQLAVIQRMVRDLNLPVKIAPVETVREPDGLALSSRNQYLNAEERAQATVIRRALLEAASAAKAGKTDARYLRWRVEKTIASAPLAKIDYVEVVDAATLEPVTRVEKPALLAVAVFFGKTRLIDNIRLTPPA
jgi:pantoate--beta-alanine ligase